jgi:hypothetical protein
MKPHVFSGPVHVVLLPLSPAYSALSMLPRRFLAKFPQIWGEDMWLTMLT